MSNRREVEAGEHRRVPLREGGKRRSAGDEDPDLVSVPERADRLEQRLAILLLPPEHRQQHPDPEVESLEDEVPGPEEAEDPEPENLERHEYPGAAIEAPPSDALSSSGGSSRAYRRISQKSVTPRIV